MFSYITFYEDIYRKLRIMGNKKLTTEKWRNIRDWGIWVIAGLLLLNFVLWNHHDHQVKNDVLPRIDTNHALIQKNVKQLDILTKKYDSLVNACRDSKLQKVKK